MRQEPLPGCVPIDHLITPDGDRTFVRANGGADLFTVHYYRREADGALVGRVLFGAGCQGPPGHAHGGSMAAVLDDAMGCAAWIAGHPVVAAEIRIGFKSMIPLGRVMGLEARVRSAEGRKVHTEGRLFDLETDALHANGEGTFVRVGVRRFAQLKEEAEARAAAGAAESPSAAPGNSPAGV